jgi:hypothetical protein
MAIKLYPFLWTSIWLLVKLVKYVRPKTWVNVDYFGRFWPFFGEQKGYFLFKNIFVYIFCIIICSLRQKPYFRQCFHDIDPWFLKPTPARRQALHSNLQRRGQGLRRPCCQGTISLSWSRFLSKVFPNCASEITKAGSFHVRTTIFVLLKMV